MKKIFFVNFDPDLWRVFIKGLAGRTGGEQIFLVSAIGAAADKKILRQIRNINLVILALESRDINKNIFMAMSARRAFKGPIIVVADNVSDSRDVLGALGDCPDIYDSTREGLPGLVAEILFPTSKF